MEGGDEQFDTREKEMSRSHGRGDVGRGVAGGGRGGRHLDTAWPYLSNIGGSHKVYTYLLLPRP